jgi:putative membrane protein
MTGTDGDNFFTPGERQRIRQAVTAAETGTSGEIATMVVARSDSYREAVTLGAVLAAGLVALVIAVAAHHITIWTYLPLTLLAYFPCRLLISRLPALQRPFITRERLHESVRERAVRAFYEKGLYRTRHETGILIFISLFERKVWILGDRGINSRIAPESWQMLAQTLTTGIRDGRACDALCGVIASCGEELARHFPREADDRNELADELLT